MAFFWQDLEEITGLSILRSRGSLLSVRFISWCLKVGRRCWLNSLRGRNYRSVRHSVKALAPAFFNSFMSAFLFLVELFELLLNLVRCSPALLIDLQLLTLVHLVKVLLNSLLLVHILAHDSLFLLLFFRFLLFHLVFQITLVLLFLHLFYFLRIYRGLCSDCLPWLSWSYEVPELVSEWSSSATLAKLRHEIIGVAVVEIQYVLLASFRGSIGVLAHHILRADLSWLHKSHPLLVLRTVESAMDLLFRSENLLTGLICLLGMVRCYDTCHLLIQIIIN